MQILKDIILEGSKSKTVKVVIDTGASMTLLPKKIADEIGVRYTGEKQPLGGAFESLNDIAEVAIVNIKFPFLNNLNYVAKVAVSTKAIGVLIGMDILNPLKIIIDTNTHQIVVKDEMKEAVKTGLMIVGGAAVLGTILYVLFRRRK